MIAAGCGAAICLAAQPRTINGSPDTLIVRGVEDTLSVTGALADAIVKAVSGKTTAAAIKSAIDGAAKRFGAGKIAKPIERELLHGALLGALDAFYESETERFVPVESFRSEAPEFLLAITDARFAARPLGEAIKAFLSKKAVTRDVFDAMEKSAQRRAFTVANAANEAMVRTVKQELLRQLAVGADLADFGKHAAKRFESAGWTPANSSHVETVFRTNVLGAYNGGRIRQMTEPAVLDARPFWESLPVGDGPPRQRATHRNFVLRAADPFWQTAAPPYGYNCRCRLRSLSVRQGAGRVQEGSSIHGLPDHGFASGISTMFEGGDLPSTKPANDPAPEHERANDTAAAEAESQPEPAPRGGRKPKPANDTRAPNAIEDEIKDIRRKIDNLARRRKPAPQAEFDALKRRIADLLAELARARR
jgi:hypothetical protein